MQTPQTRFTVLAVKDCPLYRIGEAFTLTGLALTAPPTRPICIILASDINALSESGGGSMPVLHNGNTFDCSGCGGTIKIGMERKAVREDWLAQEKTLENIAGILSAFSMFRSLDEHQIKNLVAFIHLAQYQPDEWIIRKGEPGRYLFILLSGRAEVRNETGRVIAELKKGDVCGEMSLLSGDPAGASVCAVTPVKALYFKSRNFRKVLHTYPSLQLYLARLLSKRLAQTMKKQLEEAGSGLSGSLMDTPPPELCQTINLNRKTGVLTLRLNSGVARIWFRDGNIIKAEYGDRTLKEAFFEILKCKDGHFHFHPELSPEDTSTPQIGHFMCLLMEGVSRMDEENKPTQTQTP